MCVYNHNFFLCRAFLYVFLGRQVMKEMCEDPWDADFIDKIGEDRQLLYDLILVRHKKRFAAAQFCAREPMNSFSSVVVLFFFYSCSMPGCELYGCEIAAAPRVREGRVADQSVDTLWFRLKQCNGSQILQRR